MPFFQPTAKETDFLLRKTPRYFLLFAVDISRYVCFCLLVFFVFCLFVFCEQLANVAAQNTGVRKVEFASSKKCSRSRCLRFPHLYHSWSALFLSSCQPLFFFLHCSSILHAMKLWLRMLLKMLELSWLWKVKESFSLSFCFLRPFCQLLYFLRPIHLYVCQKPSSSPWNHLNSMQDV